MAKSTTTVQIPAEMAEAFEAWLKANTKAPAKKAKKGSKKGKKFIKAQRDARQARWEAAKCPSAGMTSAQRREVAAKLPKGYSRKQFDKACLKFKANGFR